MDEEIELWIETRPCNLRSDCSLAQYHIHVSDQLFWDLDEVKTAYGRDLPFKGMLEGRGGRSGHQDHIHVSFDPVLAPSTIVAGLPGNKRPAQPGDTPNSKPSGIVVSTDLSNHSTTSTTRAIDFNMIQPGLANIAKWLGVPVSRSPEPPKDPKY